MSEENEPDLGQGEVIQDGEPADQIKSDDRHKTEKLANAVEDTGAVDQEE